MIFFSFHKFSTENNMYLLCCISTYQHEKFVFVSIEYFHLGVVVRFKYFTITVKREDFRKLQTSVLYYLLFILFVYLSFHRYEYVFPEIVETYFQYPCYTLVPSCINFANAHYIYTVNKTRSKLFNWHKWQLLMASLV